MILRKWNFCIVSRNRFFYFNPISGPRLFSSCPMNEHHSLVWFTDLWNFSVVPYVISAVKQASKTRTNDIQWNDPLEWIEARLELAFLQIICTFWG